MHHQPTGILFDLRKFSIHDGPGIRTAVFFKGCPLRCAWCHNPESQSSRAELILHPNRCIACLACAQVCPHGAVQQQDEQLYTDRQKCQVCGECMRACYADGRQIVGRRYTVDEVMAIIERDRAFYTQSGGGVTFTGGEPLQQIAFLKALLQAAKAGGLHTAVDTCGYATWEKLLSITPWVDLFLYDLKLIDDARHRRYTGVSNRRILQNLRRLCAMGKQVIVRIPVIPGVNDDPQNLVAAGQFLSSLPGLQRVDLLAYHPSAEQKYDRLGKPYPLAGLTSPSQECMQDIATLFNQAGLQVVIGG
jgi:pyruvate formate lyase activating enzyme